MEPSLWTFKGPDQAFSDWVCGDCEAREHVISSFLHVPFTSIQPLFCCHIWIEVYLCYDCPFCVFSWLFSSCRTDCGFHALEYFAKWEGRIVPPYHSCNGRWAPKNLHMELVDDWRFQQAVRSTRVRGGSCQENQQEVQVITWCYTPDAYLTFCCWGM